MTTQRQLSIFISQYTDVHTLATKLITLMLFTKKFFFLFFFKLEQKMQHNLTFMAKKDFKI